MPIRKQKIDVPLFSSYLCVTYFASFFTSFYDLYILSSFLDKALYYVYFFFVKRWYFKIYRQYDSGLSLILTLLRYLTETMYCFKLPDYDDTAL